MASTNPLIKVARQHETTWTQLHKRIADIPFRFEEIFPEDIATFLRHKAVSLNSSIGYLTPSLLTTTAFLSAKNGCTVQTLTHEQPINMYTMFVGYPGTGKSSAIQYGCLQPIADLFEDDNSSVLIDRTTSSGLVKQLATKQSGYLVSPEVFDVLNKLLKNDEDNASGDAMLLCKLFSGEPTSYSYSTEQTREIPSNTPFSILGCTQMPNAAKLIARMDHGQGLIDRFLITVPLALCPTSAEVETAQEYLSTEPEDTIKQVFQYINDCQQLQTLPYTFDEDAKQLLKSRKDHFIAQVNDAIQDGSFLPPKSKQLDLIPRLATALHVFTVALNNLLAGHAEIDISTTIPLNTLQCAVKYVDYLEMQKHMLCQVSLTQLHTS